MSGRTLQPGLLWSVLGCSGLLLAGCGRTFYLPEADIATYRYELRTAAAANNFLHYFQNQVIQIEFDSSGRVRQTNIVPVLRANGYLATAENLHYINLDRLSAEIEGQLNGWIGEHLQLLRQPDGSSVGLERLDRATVRVLAAPTLRYAPERSTIFFDTRVSLSLTGRIHVDIVSSAVAWVVGLFGGNPSGEYDVTITVADYGLSGQARIPDLATEAGWVRILLQPQPRGVSVSSDSAPADVKKGVQQLAARELAVPVDAAAELRYNNFLLAVALRPDGLSATYHSLPPAAEPLLDIVGRGNDGKLWHTRKNLAAWRDFTAVPFPERIAGDPALVASGPGLLELAAVTERGDLDYSAWREGAWGNLFRATLPNGGHVELVYQAARPALVATAPGQVEIIALSTDGELWHLRRLNGEWKDAVVLRGTRQAAQPPLRDPVAVRYANRIGLFYADRRNRLFGAVFDLEKATWGPAIEIPSSPQGIRLAPTAVACSNQAFDLVYVGSDGAPYHRVIGINPENNAMTYGREERIEGLLNSSPALACSAYQQLELLARGTNNLLYHNHYVGSSSPQGLLDGRTVNPGWQGWLLANNPYFGTSFAAQRVSDSIIAASTRTGEVQVAALQLGDGPNPLLHNSYDTRRFGTSAWKAVHWKGIQTVGSTNLVGRPALAVSDRQVRVGSALHTGTLLLRSLAEDNRSLPDALTVESVRLSVDPVLLSSAPGVEDVFFVSQDGGLRLMRTFHSEFNRGLGQTIWYPEPSGAIGAIAAVSPAIGQIDVVAFTVDHSLHHWRWINGSWQGPTKIPGTVISAPILIDTGAGQLELFAVGGDLNLWHWRFVNAAWTAGHQIPGNFGVSTGLRSSSASSWGDGTVDLVVAASQTGKMYHTRVLPGADSPAPGFVLPGEEVFPIFTEIGGKTLYSPALTAFGPDHLHLLAIGTDNKLYENWARPLGDSRTASTIRARTPSTIRGVRLGLNLQWSGFLTLTGEPVTLGGVARLGDRDIAAVTLSGDRRLFVSRFEGWRWQGFTPIRGLPPQPTLPQSFRPLLSVY